MLCNIGRCLLPICIYQHWYKQYRSTITLKIAGPHNPYFKQVQLQCSHNRRHSLDSLRHLNLPSHFALPWMEAYLGRRARPLSVTKNHSSNRRKHCPQRGGLSGGGANGSQQDQQTCLRAPIHGQPAKTTVESGASRGHPSGAVVHEDACCQVLNAVSLRHLQRLPESLKGSKSLTSGISFLGAGEKKMTLDCRRAQPQKSDLLCRCGACPSSCLLQSRGRWHPPTLTLCRGPSSARLHSIMALAPCI